MSSASKLPVIALASAVVLLPMLADTQIVFAQEGYFSKGDKTVPIVSAGTRSKTENTVVLSLVGASLAVGALGTYYALDARSLSDEVSASTHTNLVWSPQRDAIYADSDRSAKIAQITLGIGGVLFASTIAAYIFTSPDRVESRRKMQSRLQSIPTLSIPNDGGFVVRQRWSY